MAISHDAVIQVSTSELASAAATLKERIQTAKASYGNVMTIVQNTQRYWIGEAGDEHRRAFLDQQDDIDQILARLTEHHDDLLKIAGIYEPLEQKTKEIVQAPVTNLIV